MPVSSTSARSISSARPTPSCAPTLEEETEPEVTQLTAVIPQSEDVPPPQAFPYVTHTIDSDRDDVQEIARTPCGGTFVQHVCRNMNDVEANEAVMNKHWFRQVADAEAPHLQTKMGVSTRLHMTRPQWVEQRLQQSEAALWSAKKDNGPDPASSSHGLPPDEVQLPLHAMLQPSIEHIETFLADEFKEMEQLSAQRLRTNLHRQMKRLRKSKNVFARRKSMSKRLQSKRQMRRMRMKTLGRATVSSCFDPAFCAWQIE